MPLISRLGPILLSRNLSEAMTKRVDAKMWAVASGEILLVHNDPFSQISQQGKVYPKLRHGESSAEHPRILL